jgi:replication factor C subunit 1
MSSNNDSPERKDMVGGDPALTALTPPVAAKSSTRGSVKASKAKSKAGGKANSKAKSTGGDKSASASPSPISPSPASPSPTDSRLALDALKIAVTGVMHMGREALEDLIVDNGGRVVSSVSGRTSFLVAGERLDDDRPAAESRKYRTAVDKRVMIVSEAELLRMIEEHEQAMPDGGTIRGKGDRSSSGGSVGSEDSGGSGESVGKVSSSGSRYDLWVDRYKPTHTAQLVGSSEVVRKLTDWLVNWDTVHLHLHHTEARRTTKGPPKAPPKTPTRAVLLSGPQVSASP